MSFCRYFCHGEKLGSKLTIKDTDLGMREFFRNLEDDKNLTHTKVGILGGGEELEKAIKNEFGDKASGTPERPFMRASFDAIESDLQKQAVSLGGLVIDGSITKEKALGKLGDTYIARIYKYIRTREHGIANSKATIEKKGSDLPLIDTGRMQGSIKQELKK